MYYFYRKSNRGHGICPLYRGCPPFGESVIRGFTVVHDDSRLSLIWMGGLHSFMSVLIVIELY